ncbi:MULTISPECIES: ABC transporter permease [unclassified Granulicatella]|uniref:ABC transporter permease n=1 Tax=unclassified Granulicatella TaxID=2630493 RepID=UPI001072F18B|nr:MULTISPECIES: ABC transporter permease [unclassified Granulicatella]MBF0779826.1 ABC transporter permease [Granulicatella sp. 19428wC4_WM01]TFU96126.1 ABC transporter permease [Granulicatella sp. WM01]
MWKVILKRVLVMIPQIIILSAIVFFLAKLMPGDALTGKANSSLTVADIEALREANGWNKPWHEQYIDWAAKALRGDFGISYANQRPVVDAIGERLEKTVWLSILTTIIMYIIAVPLGMIAGRYQNSWADKTINFLNFLNYSIPTFVAGLLAIWLFGYTLGWFPTRGTETAGAGLTGLAYVLDRFKHILLPAIILGTLTTVSTIQYLRTGIIDSKGQDYVKTARAKGVPMNKVYSQHIFRNSILPIVTFIGYDITSVLGGSVFLENIFSFPGMGKLFIDAINGRDYSLMVALILMYGLAGLFGSLISDIAIAIVDPRIRIQ